jgi:coenzyme PQQ precursor peptide PqqA
MLAEADGIFALPVLGRLLPEETGMAWKAPKIVEISLALEINSYACAEID